MRKNVAGRQPQSEVLLYAIRPPWIARRRKAKRRLNHVWFESGSSRGVGEAARIPI